MAVSVRKNGGLSFGEPHVLFEGAYLVSFDIGPSYAASPDGRRFLMARHGNWFEDMHRLTQQAH